MIEMVVKESPKLVEAAKQLMRAHEVFTSVGSTRGAYDRHIWPVIKDIKQAIDEIDKSPSDFPQAREGYAAGLRDSEDPVSYGMYAGIAPTIEEIEEYTPYFEPGQPRRRCFIFYFDGDGNQHIVAEWKNSQWVGSDGT